jgi:hypothetical protein
MIGDDMDEKQNEWMKSVIAQYQKEQEAILSPLWAVGFKDRGLGRGDYAVIIEGTTKVVVECPSKEIAEHIVALHNKEHSDGNGKDKKGKTQGKPGRRQSAPANRKPRKR